MKVGTIGSYGIFRMPDSLKNKKANTKDLDSSGNKASSKDTSMSSRVFL